MQNPDFKVGIIMELMDGLRARWGVRYPMDDQPQ